MKTKIKELKSYKDVVKAIDGNKMKKKHKWLAEQYLRGKLAEKRIRNET